MRTLICIWKSLRLWGGGYGLPLAGIFLGWMLVVGLIMTCCGCASTTVHFSPDGTVLDITHRRFIIDEQFAVHGGKDWTAECKSKPDEASVAVAAGLLQMAAQAAKAAAK